MISSTRKICLVIGLAALAGFIAWTGFYLRSNSGRLDRKTQPINSAVAVAVPAEGPSATFASASLTAEEIFRNRYHLAQPPRAVASAPTDENSESRGTSGQMILKIRAISLNRASGNAIADRAMAQNLLEEIQKSPLFAPATQFTGSISDEEAPGTFTFTIAAKLKKPLKL